MRATVLVDNISENQLTQEWGLSIFIEYNEKKILLDTGASDNFYKNACKLNIDMGSVDYGVLSHAHYDHADGMDTFFANNQKAKFYLQKACAENCYGKRFIFSKYIGIKRGLLDRFKDRIVYVDNQYEIEPGITLLPHKTEGLSELGRQNHLYIKKARSWHPDDFAHEQSLVLDTQAGLVIFNSCSHGGADTIIQEVSAAFPSRKIHAIIGGFHLYQSSEKYILELADRINSTGIEKVYTGHCTGQRAFELLREKSGNKVQQLKTGLIIES